MGCSTYPLENSSTENPTAPAALQLLAVAQPSSQVPGLVTYVPAIPPTVAVAQPSSQVPGLVTYVPAMQAQQPSSS
eukprot:gene8610-34048_t